MVTRSLANSGRDNITSRISNRSGDGRWKKAFGWEISPRSRVAAAPSTAVAAPTSTEGFEIVFRPDPCVWDGSYTNNAFLQELAKPTHQTDLGQCRADQRKYRPKARRIQRRYAANYQRGKNAGYPRMDSPRLAGRYRYASFGIRPLARGIDRHGNGVQRLRADGQRRIRGLLPARRSNASRGNTS